MVPLRRWSIPRKGNFSNNKNETECVNEHSPGTRYCTYKRGRWHKCNKPKPERTRQCKCWAVCDFVLKILLVQSHKRVNIYIDVFVHLRLLHSCHRPRLYVWYRVTGLCSFTHSVSLLLFVCFLRVRTMTPGIVTNHFYYHKINEQVRSLVFLSIRCFCHTLYTNEILLSSLFRMLFDNPIISIIAPQICYILEFWFVGGKCKLLTKCFDVLGPF